MYRIELKVIEARNLKIGDVFTLSSDPFVKIHTSQATQQTHVARKTRNPYWNQSFNLIVRYGEDIRFEIVDYDNFKKNDHLGSAYYRITNTPRPGEVIDTWLSVSGKGELHIQIIYQQPYTMVAQPTYHIAPKPQVYHQTVVMPPPAVYPCPYHVPPPQPMYPPSYPMMAPPMYPSNPPPPMYAPQPNPPYCPPPTGYDPYPPMTGPGGYPLGGYPPNPF